MDLCVSGSYRKDSFDSVTSFLLNHSNVVGVAEQSSNTLIVFTSNNDHSLPSKIGDFELNIFNSGLLYLQGVNVLNDEELYQIGWNLAQTFIADGTVSRNLTISGPEAKWCGFVDCISDYFRNLHVKS